MNGDELIVDVSREKGIVRGGELSPHCQRENTGGSEQEQRCDEVEYADVFVIGRIEPSFSGHPQLLGHSSVRPYYRTMQSTPLET